MTRRLGWPVLRIALWTAAPILLVLALRGLDLPAVARTLARLGPLQISILLTVNCGVVAALAGRWWAILAADGFRLPYLATTLYRLAGFGITYFTPGTQFGGEPLQVHLVHRRHAVPQATAAAAILLDRALELMANFGFLALGLGVVIRLGIYPQGTAALLTLAAVALATIPAIYLVGAWTGHSPGSWVLQRIPGRQPPMRWLERLRAGVAETESEVSRMARTRPAGLILGLGFTILSWALLLAEWWLVLDYLGIPLDPARLLAVVTATRLALFVPIPGALGALEASLVLALSALGFTAEQALGVALVVRVRDLSFAGAGLWLGGALAGRRGAIAATAPDPIEPSVNHRSSDRDLPPPSTDGP
jgi:uncharacterized protein (TIRG00374 family)